jgi:hypothetical protein
MRFARPLLPLALLAAVAAALVAAPLVAMAQQKPIQQEMSPEEFKAAGLDKLSPEELARLNAWLGRKIDTVASEAAAQAKDKVEQENRGFFHFGSQDPIVARIQGEFRGFARLDSPEVRITPSITGNAWYLAVKGFNTRAKVERVK